MWHRHALVIAFALIGAWASTGCKAHKSGSSLKNTDVVDADAPTDLGNAEVLPNGPEQRLLPPVQLQVSGSTIEATLKLPADIALSPDLLSVKVAVRAVAEIKHSRGQSEIQARPWSLLPMEAVDANGTFHRTLVLPYDRVYDIKAVVMMTNRPSVTSTSIVQVATNTAEDEPAIALEFATESPSKMIARSAVRGSERVVGVNLWIRKIEIKTALSPEASMFSEQAGLEVLIASPWLNVNMASEAGGVFSKPMTVINAGERRPAGIVLVRGQTYQIYSVLNRVGASSAAATRIQTITVE